MFFRNDDPGPLNENECRAMHDALRHFRTEDEVRFGPTARYLAPILNTLAQTNTKFYLIHLPDNCGWVLRRHRPTGEFLGRAPTDVAEPVRTEPGPAPADPAGGRAPAPLENRNGEFAEEYFGVRGGSRVGVQAPGAHPPDDAGEGRAGGRKEDAGDGPETG